MTPQKDNPMTKHQQLDLERRTTDLQGALQAIGRLVTDASQPPRRRIERVLGILEMYACAPPRKDTP